MLSTVLRRLSTVYQSPPWTPLWLQTAVSQPLLDKDTLILLC